MHSWPHVLGWWTLISLIAVVRWVRRRRGAAPAAPADGDTIHSNAPHLLADGTVGGPLHHDGEPIADAILPCLLLHSTDLKARLVVKTLACQDVPLLRWHRHVHDHQVAIATGRVQILDVSPDTAQKLAEAAAKTDGILFSLWHDDQTIPDGRVTFPTAPGHSLPQPH